METIEQIANKNGGLPVVVEVAGGLEVGGLFVGRQLEDGLYAERVMSGRWLIRSSQGLLTHPTRMGEVTGGDRRFVACLMNGDQVEVKPSLLLAAKSLAQRKAARHEAR
jgi:hypothetical protein